MNQCMTVEGDCVTISKTDRGSDMRDPESGNAVVDESSDHAARWRRVRWVLLTIWLVAMIWQFSVFGLAFDRTRLILWMCVGLAAASIGRRKIITVVIDWLPFALVLILYDLTRSVAEWMGMPTHWHLAPEIDHALFGVNPTVWLQAHIKSATPPWWEVVTSVVYISYFVLPYAVAGVLWLRDRVAWRRYAVAFVATTFLGLVGYTLVPAAPPWAAARCTSAEVVGGPRAPDCMFTPELAATGGILGKQAFDDPSAAPYVERISARGWEALHVKSATQLVQVGQTKANLVAAIPSLHAALTMLVALFLWPRLRALGRTLSLGYAFTMAFTLVYTGEHYVFDILLGWALAAAVIVVQRYWLMRRRASRESTAVSDEALVSS